jgi:hypothetical protein
MLNTYILFLCNDDVTVESNSEDDTADFDGLRSKIKIMLANFKINLDHDYMITPWILSIMSEVTKDVDALMTAVEWVVECHYLPPFPSKNMDVQNMSSINSVDKFWDKYKDFRQKLNWFSKPGK